MPIFSWNVPLISLFLERSLVFPILLFSSISLYYSFKKAFISPPAFFWNSAFSWVYLSLFPLPFTFLLSSAICKASSDNHYAFFHFFFFGMVSVTVSCTRLWTFIHSSSGTLSTRSNPLNLLVTSTVWSKGIWFKSYLNGLVIFPAFLNLSLNFYNEELIIWATVSSRSCFCWPYTASPSLTSKNTINLI